MAMIIMWHEVIKPRIWVSVYGKCASEWTCFQMGQDYSYSRQDEEQTMKQTIDFLAECEALSAVVDPLDGDDFARPTQFKGWRIEDVIVHLYFWNVQADQSIFRPDEFSKTIADILTDIQKRGMRPVENERITFRGAALDEIIDTYSHKIGPRNGAKVVAKAWMDPDFRAALFADATSAVRDLGYYGRQGEHMVVVENSETTHNLVVCTLCSCYPWPLLGIPPGWYKSDAYRARAVREPRAILSEFGTTLAPETKIRVWDSTAEIRYLVIPERPAGTDGWSEDQLAGIVTRDAMIGTKLVEAPA